MTAFAIATPEIFLLAALCLVLLIGLFFQHESQVVTYLTTLLALLSTALLTYGSSFGKRVREVGLDRMYILDDLSGLLKVSILLLSCMYFVYARKYLRDQAIWRSEFFVLSMTATLGMMIIVSGYHILVLYLGLEMLSLSLYALIAMRRDHSHAVEAAMKYFILGALASGLLLYGVSLLYGLSGTLAIDQLAIYFSSEKDQLATNLPALLALVFIVAGMSFKLGIVPFHFWLPDVYEGAPTAMTLFLSSIPKVAALALMIRFLAEGMGAISEQWGQLLLMLGLLSVVFGNMAAIAQTKLKRMLAYSTIAHMGFIFVGMMTATHTGYSAALFYTLVYALMTMGAFAVLIMLGQQGAEPEDLEDLRGLHERHPWVAFMMLLILLSMLGFPLTVGFYAKLTIIQALVDVRLVWAAVILVVMSVIGAFYYLRLIKIMYFDKPLSQQPLQAGLDFHVLLSVNGLLMLALGVFPSALMAICSSVLFEVFKTGNL